MSTSMPRLLPPLGPSTIWIRRPTLYWWPTPRSLPQEPSMVEDSDIEGLRAGGMSRGSTKPRRSSPCSTTAVEWKLLRDCPWIGYRKQHNFPKQPLVSGLRRLAPGSRLRALERVDLDRRLSVLFGLFPYELPRTPLWRSSQNPPSTHSGEYS